MTKLCLDIRTDVKKYKIGCSFTVHTKKVNKPSKQLREAMSKGSGKHDCGKNDFRLHSLMDTILLIVFNLKK